MLSNVFMVKEYSNFMTIMKLNNISKFKKEKKIENCLQKYAKHASLLKHAGKHTIIINYIYINLFILKKILKQCCKNETLGRLFATVE